MRDIHIFIKRNEDTVGYAHIFKNENGSIIAHNYQGSYKKEDVSDPELFTQAKKQDKVYTSEKETVLEAFNEVYDFWMLPQKTREPNVIPGSIVTALAELFQNGDQYIAFMEPKEGNVDVRSR